jgi:glycosyltransferase involved in cell wall biosynthesis
VIISLFFTRGISLAVWLESGIFAREKKIYEELLNTKVFAKVYWITYGKSDADIAKKLKLDGLLHKNIDIVGIPKYLWFLKNRSWIYSLIIPFIHYKILKCSDAYKTNQMDGAWAALISKFLFKRKLIVRTGYMLSNAILAKGFFKKNISIMIEKLIYRFADLAIVTSQHDKIYVQNNYPVKHLEIIPNYVDTSLFKPLNGRRCSHSLLYVGRLSEDKNLFNLIEGCSRSGFNLDLYGSGFLRDKLEMFANNLPGDFRFYDPVPNNRLPEIYNQYAFYILASPKEGMPKTLIEAMACGCVCIGTNVEGINEIINDENGLMIEDISVKSITNLLLKIRTKKYDDFTSIVGKSLRMVEKEFSIKHLVKKESRLIRNVLNV